MSKTYLLIDGMNSFFRAKHVVRAETIEEKVGQALHVNLMITRKAWKKFDADHLVFCTEGRSWRYEVYPKYKASRKVTKSDLTPEQVAEDKAFFEGFQNYVDFMKEQTNATVLQHPMAEADDMIARWIATHPDDNHIIVSSDGDFLQLVDHNVKIFNGVKDVVIDSKGVWNDKGKRIDFSLKNDGGIKVGKRLLSSMDPLPVAEDWIDYSLFCKIVRGDAGDGIFSAYPGVRQKGSSKKVGINEAFQDRHKQGYNWFNFMNQRWTDEKGKDHIVKDKIEENEMLIDLKKIPEECQEAFDEYIKEQEAMPTIPQVGIHFLRFANQYEMMNILKDPNDFVEMLNARI